jgi:hypothetical protein
MYVFVYTHKCTCTTSYLLVGPTCLWCNVCNDEMSYTIVIAITFLVPLENLQWEGVHQGSFIMFKVMM